MDFLGLDNRLRPLPNAQIAQNRLQSPTSPNQSPSESISPQLQDQASPSIQISASEMISPTLQEQVSEQAQISINETITPTLQDLPTTQVDVSASETIAPTLQEQVNVTAGGTYHIVEPLDIDITEDELEVDISD
jgi:hypothetical protein